MYLEICEGMYTESEKQATLRSYKGMSLVRSQAIIQPNDHLLSIEPLETHFNRMFLQEIETYYAKWQPFCFSRIQGAGFGNMA